MIRLALVGKNISHSKSPSLYKELLQDNVEYQLLDYQNESDIPPLEDIFKTYRLDGVSITAPYKKVFLNQLENKADFFNLPINTIKKSNGKFFATNTDELATFELLEHLKQKHNNPYVVLLGSGSMAQITVPILRKLNLTYDNYSRRNGDDVERLNLIDKVNQVNRKILVINACSRDFLFKGHINSNVIFWDYNYNMPDQKSYIENTGALYIDGLELLKKQAIHALRFWKINY